MSHIAKGRAIAVFNPTAPGPGFLQPLFAGPPGDNKNYVQILTHPARIASFLPVSWPERDSVALADEIDAAVGGESLWGFAFGDEAPLVLPWTDFRKAMQRRLAASDLLDYPLLRFDIVDTLDLEPLKRSVFTRAFERYREIGRDAAEHWRDRAILEPALAKALGISTRSVAHAAHDRSPYFRARINGGEVSVAIENQPGDELALNEAYRVLQRDFPEIFPAHAEVAVRLRQRPVPRRSKHPGFTIVLVGRIGRGRVDHERWARQDVEVVHSDHFPPEPNAHSAAGFTIILGAQSDWRELAEVGKRTSDQSTLIITLSASPPPLTRDFELQNGTAHPTVSYFAPFATSTALGRDPAQPISALVHLLREEMNFRSGTSLPPVAPHSLLLREPARANQSPVETICRLGARALSAGAVLDGSARFYVQGRASEDDRQEWYRLLQSLFSLEPVRFRIELPGRRRSLLLLVERAAPSHHAKLVDRMFEGVGRLLEIRGWQVSGRNGRHLTLADHERRFEAMFLESGASLPAENPHGRTPALGRAPLLVVHASPKRQQLLVGNRGEFFHVSLEDIALMAPGTQWVWPVLRRQLLESTQLTLEALRLAAALVAEAIRMNRIQASFVDVDWPEVAQIMGASDCERFVDFNGRGIENGHAILVVNVNNDRAPPRRGKAIIQLAIEDDGPVVSAAVDLIF